MKPLTKTAVGDVSSTDIGSAARDNGGKLQWGLNLFRNLFPVLGTKATQRFLPYMADFQEDPSLETANALIRAVYILADNLGYLSTQQLYEDTTRVWERGAVKYSAWNWASGQPWSVPLDSMFRHLLAISNGESIDIESKLPHVAHILCNAIMLYHFVEHYPQLNDLPPQHFFDVASPEDAS